MIVHVLAGDCLAEQLPESITGEKIICRECLIVGGLSGETLSEFWQSRADFIQSEYGENSYFEKTVAEFEKLEKLDKESEINLWFEYELFCQVNLWFTIYLLNLQGLSNMYLVLPIVQTEIWKGFGNLEAKELEQCFAKRKKLSAEEIELGVKLWQAYKINDLKKLQKISNIEQTAFPTLKEVCQAEIERKTENRVENSIEKIIDMGEKDFNKVFVEFQKIEGVYGFGDLQVKKIYEQLTK